MSRSYHTYYGYGFPKGEIVSQEVLANDTIEVSKFIPFLV